MIFRQNVRSILMISSAIDMMIVLVYEGIGFFVREFVKTNDMVHEFVNRTPSGGASLCTRT